VIERTGKLNVPALCDAELVAGLRQIVRRNVISSVRALEAISDYDDLPLVRHEHTTFLARAFELETFSAYDAIYVALAERLGARLLTTDRRLARAVASTRGVRIALA
jgi:predicted nucleic acid-binding protein